MKLKPQPIQTVQSLCAALLLAATATPANSQTSYNFPATIDLTTGYTQDAGNGNAFYVIPFSGSLPTYTLLAGDSISGHISFADNRYLQVTDPGGVNLEYLYLAFYPFNNASSSTSFSSSTTLLGVSGQLNVSNPRTGGGLGNGVIAAQFSGLTDSSLTFTGLDYSITLNSYSGANSFVPGNLQIFAGAGDISVLPAPTPEPSTLALAGLGAAGMFFARRRRV